MKTRCSRIALVLMALLFGCITFMPAALAEDELIVQIDTQIGLEGTLPATPEAFVIRMTAMDSDNPMPNGSKGGSFDFTVTGAQSTQFPEIRFDDLGIYKYTIKQIAGKNKDCAYDQRVYNLTISIVNGDDGRVFAVVAMLEEGKEEKSNLALFHNVYKTKVTSPGEITATGVNDNLIWYFGGAAVLLVGAMVIIHLLRRKEDCGCEGK